MPLRRIVVLVMVCTLVAAVAGCEMSEEREVALGRDNASQVDARMPIVRDPAVSEYMQSLGAGIARSTSRADLDWRFSVVDSRDVNAFALPGGFIYVNRGLIERAGELDELAGAIAHEVGHVVRRHSVKQIEKQSGANTVIGATCSLTSLCNSDLSRVAIQIGGAALFARYSRHDEAEADSEAVLNVVRAGYDPDGIPRLFERLLAERRRSPLRIEGFFASHPMEEARIEATRREIASIDRGTAGRLVRDDEAYRAFRARLAALPRAPDRAVREPELAPRRAPPESP
ncbi:MAG: M48 family metalloprotease [Gemmatimonadaceae bacterium]|nr:M48 family metalloprotease [Gemmatimonadaceae bacterium]